MVLFTNHVDKTQSSEKLPHSGYVAYFAGYRNLSRPWASCRRAGHLPLSFPSSHRPGLQQGKKQGDMSVASLRDMPHATKHFYCHSHFE